MFEMVVFYDTWHNFEKSWQPKELFEQEKGFQNIMREKSLLRTCLSVWQVLEVCDCLIRAQAGPGCCFPAENMICLLLLLWLLFSSVN